MTSVNPEPESLREIQDEAGAAYMAAHSYDEDTVTPDEFNAYVAACRDAGLRAVFLAGRDSRDGIVVPRELLQRMDQRISLYVGTQLVRSLGEKGIAEIEKDRAELRRLLAGHATDKEN